MLQPLRRFLAGLLVALVVASALPLLLVEVRVRAEDGRAPAAATFGELIDAVARRTAEAFWDKDRLVAIGWERRAAEMRQAVADAPSLEEAARRINLLLGELGSSHTKLLTPDDIDYYVLGSAYLELLHAKPTFAGIGAFSARIDGRDFIDQVLEGSAADRAGLKVGYEIVSVDGAPYHPVRSFRGKTGTEAAIALRRSADGQIETVQVNVGDIEPRVALYDATLASARVIVHDGLRIAYVHVWASLPESVDALQLALEQVGYRARRKDDTPAAPPDLDGLVVDLRGKIGGLLSTPARYLQMLDPRGPQTLGRDRNGERALGPASLRGRTVVLIDPHTRSAAEIFAHSYKRERLGPLIGTRTAGAVRAAGMFATPGDTRLHMAVLDLTIDGEILEGAGVAPDIEVPRPLPYSKGADPVLEAAVTWLAGKAAGKDGRAVTGSGR